jgi:hypothetical protein
MNSFPEPNNAGDLSSVDETLQLIAHAPVPEGLAERVRASLDARLAAGPRKGLVLLWPKALKPGSNWMRSAAAAAIVFVVAGGGWGVYSRVQPGPAAKVAVPPPHVAVPGGFSNAGAMRTPQTLNGPVLSHPVAQPHTANPAVKTSTQTAQKLARHAKSGLAIKAGDQPAAPAAK